MFPQTPVERRLGNEAAKQTDLAGSPACGVAAARVAADLALLSWLANHPEELAEADAAAAEAAAEAAEAPEAGADADPDAPAAAPATRTETDDADPR